jgi:hypothetical protein
MTKYLRTLTAASLVLALALVLPAGQSLPKKPQTQTAPAKSQTLSQPTAMDYRRDAMGTFDQIFGEMTALMALTSYDPAKMDKAWENLVNERCTLWSNTVDQAEIVMREKEQTPAASWQEWRKDNEEFIAAEIQSAGRDVMKWRCQTYLEIFALQLDIDSHPIRKDEWLKTMTEAEKILETAEGTANDTAATVQAIEKSRSDVRQAMNLVDNVASDLAQIRKRVMEFHGAELKMDSKIAAIQARWMGLKDQYPGVLEKWKLSVSGWAKNIKTAYDSHEKIRKQFDTLFEPVMNQKLFSGLRLFQGKEYKDVGGVGDKLDQTLQVRWAKAKDKSKNDEDTAKAIEKEKQTSEQERKRYWELIDITGGQRERQEVLKYIQAADNALKERGLKLNVANHDNGAAEQKAAEEELSKYNLKSLPEQVAARKAWDEYQKQKNDALAEMTRIVAGHEARLKKLGLPPEPDWPKR